MARTDLGADHAVAPIRLLHHVGRLEGDGEAGPAATTVELLLRGEQRFSRDDVDVDPRLLLVPELVVECRLGGAFLGHGVLAVVELGYRLRVLAVVVGHFCLPGSGLASSHPIVPSVHPAAAAGQGPSARFPRDHP